MTLGSSNQKKSGQVIRGKKILYGILGSFLGFALSGVIYSIEISASDQDEIIDVNNHTTSGIIHNESSWISFNGNWNNTYMEGTIINDGLSFNCRHNDNNRLFNQQKLC